MYAIDTKRYVMLYNVLNYRKRETTSPILAFNNNNISRSCFLIQQQQQQQHNFY